MENQNNQELPLRRPPGRPRSNADMSENMASVDSSTGIMSREAIAHGETRAPRRPMNDGFKLTVPMHLVPKGVFPRWFNDAPGRIEAAQAAYWEHITDENGVNITRRNGNTTVYLMGLDKKYREEDDELKRKKTLAMMQSETKLKANEYSPTNSASALSSSESSDPDAY